MNGSGFVAMLLVCTLYGTDGSHHKFKWGLSSIDNWFMNYVLSSPNYAMAARVLGIANICALMDNATIRSQVAQQFDACYTSTPSVTIKETCQNLTFGGPLSNPKYIEEGVCGSLPQAEDNNNTLYGDCLLQNYIESGSTFSQFIADQAAATACEAYAAQLTDSPIAPNYTYVEGVMPPWGKNIVDKWVYNQILSDEILTDGQPANLLIIGNTCALMNTTCKDRVARDIYTCYTHVANRTIWDTCQMHYFGGYMNSSDVIMSNLCQAAPQDNIPLAKFTLCIAESYYNNTGSYQDFVDDTMDSYHCKAKETELFLEY